MKRKTIRNHKDFCMPKNGLRVSMGDFIVKAISTRKPDDPRYGLVVSKRNFKFAVQRNRAKRLMRDWIMANEHLMLPDLDYVFIIYNSVLECDRKKGRRKVKRALVKITKMYNQNETEMA